MFKLSLRQFFKIHYVYYVNLIWALGESYERGKAYFAFFLFIIEETEALWAQDFCSRSRI